jgi:hypothetical protein
MPDIVVQIIFMIMGAFLSVVLTRILIQNGRQIKILSEEMKIMSSEMKLFGEKMDEGFRKIGDLIVEEGRNTRELIKTVLEKK